LDNRDKKCPKGTYVDQQNRKDLRTAMFAKPFKDIDQKNRAEILPCLIPVHGMKIKMLVKEEKG